MNNYVYLLDGRAYVNLTNKCHNACTFCIRNTGDGVAGTPLWLDKTPTADEVVRAFLDVRDKLVSNEVTFCGYGEPTEELALLTECAARLKSLGCKLRLNTNGLGSLVANADISGKLTDFDTVSVSLNDCDARGYAEVTRSVYGLGAFPAVLDFADRCKARGINVVFTVVDTIGSERIAACRRLAEDMGIPLRVREYISDNYNG